MEMLDEEGSDRAHGMAAVAMTLGRLMAPGIQTDSQDIQFVEDVMDWTMAYFPAGTA